MQVIRANAIRAVFKLTCVFLLIGCVSGTIYAQTSGDADTNPPEQFWRLQTIIYPEELADPKDPVQEGLPLYESGLWSSREKGYRTFERKSDGEVIINYYANPGKPTQKLQATWHIKGDEATYWYTKYADGKYTFRLPPATIRSGEQFLIGTTFEGNGARIPRPAFSSHPNYILHEGASGGEGSPVIYHKKFWNYPGNTRAEPPGKWSLSVNTYVKPLTGQAAAEDTPLLITLHLNTGGGDGVKIHFIYTRQKAPSGNTGSGDTGSGGTGSGGTGSGGTGSGGTGSGGTGSGGTGSGGTGSGGTGSGGTGSGGTGSGGTGSGGTGSGGTGSGGPNVKDNEVNRMAMTLTSANRSVRVGEVVQAPLYLYTARDVANINFDVRYNSSVITPVGEPIQGNILTSSSIFAGSAGENGVVRIGFAGTKGVNGDGTVAEMRFRAVGKPGDKSPLRLNVTKIGDPSGNDLDILLVSGEITIVDESGLLPGDGDGDGKVTTLDALMALQMSVKLIPEKLQLDLDKDGKVTSRDAVIILQMALGA